MRVIVYSEEGRISVYRNVRSVRETWEGGIELEMPSGPDVTMGAVIKVEIVCG